MEADDTKRNGDLSHFLRDFRHTSYYSHSCKDSLIHDEEIITKETLHSHSGTAVRRYVQEGEFQRRASLDADSIMSMSMASRDFSCVTENPDLDELGDLLQRFDTYFREKLDAELQNLGEFMHGMLSEQQIHLQQILENSGLLSVPPVSPRQDSGSFVSENNADCHKNPEEESVEEYEMQLSTTESVEKQCKRSSINEILLEMMSLSCELSALLSQSKFL